MLKLGCTLPNLEKMCLLKPTICKFYPFAKMIEICWKKYEKTLLVDVLLCSSKKL